MAGNKRASMREGPLSQLFKRTDIDAPPEEQQQPAPEQRSLPSEAPAEEPRPREAADLDYAEPHIPSPKERLSAAFSHDIPHNVMERPSSEPPRRRPNQASPSGS